MFLSYLSFAFVSSDYNLLFLRLLWVWNRNFLHTPLRHTAYKACMRTHNFHHLILKDFHQNLISDMSKVSFLDFQYNLSKKKVLRKPTRLFSSRDRQNSGLTPGFEPNINEMKRVFEKFDTNKDGKISQQDYRVILRALGKGSMVGEVPKIFKLVDLDGDGFINFKEFMEVHKKAGGVKTVDIQNAFQTFDLNGDGKISAEEVMEMLKRLGERCSLEECQRMIRAVDTDGDGMVNIDEFMTMMTRSMRRA